MLGSIIKREREFIVEEQDVMDVLKAINEHLGYLNGSIGNCGWGDGEESKWFIMFYARDGKYQKIVSTLQEIGEFKLDVRPKGQIDIYFERCEECEGMTEEEAQA